MPVLIGMRCLQAIGSSAVISVGAGSLADMYEVHERGQKVSSFFHFHFCFCSFRVDFWKFSQFLHSLRCQQEQDD